MSIIVYIINNHQEKDPGGARLHRGLFHFRRFQTFLNYLCARLKM
jgi:hypothetical protein